VRALSIDTGIRSARVLVRTVLIFLTFSSTPWDLRVETLVVLTEVSSAFVIVVTLLNGCAASSFSFVFAHIVVGTHIVRTGIVIATLFALLATVVDHRVGAFPVNTTVLSTCVFVGALLIRLTLCATARDIHVLTLVINTEISGAVVVVATVTGLSTTSTFHRCGALPSTRIIQLAFIDCAGVVVGALVILGAAAIGLCILTGTIAALIRRAGVVIVALAVRCTAVNQLLRHTKTIRTGLFGTCVVVSTVLIFGTTTVPFVGALSFDAHIFCAVIVVVTIPIENAAISNFTDLLTGTTALRCTFPFGTRIIRRTVLILCTFRGLVGRHACTTRARAHFTGLSTAVLITFTTVLLGFHDAFARGHIA